MDQPLHFIASVLFGLVIGWITYRTLRRAPTSGIGDIASVIGAVGGGGVVVFVGPGPHAFDPYCIGLAIGFFLYPFAAAKSNISWLGEDRPASKSGTSIDSIIK